MTETDGTSVADVIELRPGIDLTDEQRVLHTRARAEDAAWCNHGPYDLDREAQRAYCRACKREVPLFEVLQQIAQDMERWIGYRKEAEHRGRTARANADELQRVEANAKARLRRLRTLGATVEYSELREGAQRAYGALSGRLAVFAADDDTALEVRRHLRGSDVFVDPLMSAGSWRFGLHPRQTP